MTSKQYQPKTGQPCSCRRGIERDNCPACEGTGQRIDFAKIRTRSTRALMGVNGTDDAMSLDQENQEALAVYALRIVNLERALRGVVAAFDAPHYGDRDAQIEHLFTPIEQARSLLS